MARILELFHFVVRLLIYCRFSVLTVAVGWVVMNATGQGRELSIALVGQPAEQSLFLASITIWAWAAWYWSRLMILARGRYLLRRIAVGIDPDGDIAASGAGFDWSMLASAEKSVEVWLLNHFPRLLGLFAFLSMALPIAAVGGWESWSGWIGELKWLVFAILGLGVVSYGVWYMKWTNLERSRVLGAPIPDLVAEMHGWPVVGANLVLVAGLFLFALIAPVSMGFLFGAAATTFLGLACVTIGGSAITLRTHRQGAPILLVLLVLGGLWSGLGWNDNHAVRTAGPAVARSSDFPNRMEVDEAVERWHGLDRPGVERPLVLVAAAGGGLRAAYWTATVLGAAQDLSPALRSAIFAISGVSGGSLGATVFNAVLAEGPANCRSVLARQGEAATSADLCYEATAQQVLSHDFLGPTVAGLVFTDLVQRFLPCLGSLCLPSRARALETAWEAGWDNTYATADGGRLAAPFLDLWSRPGGPWLPALLLNGTHEESGKRLLTTNLHVRGTFIDVADIYGGDPLNRDAPLFLEADMPASTAAHNSARFAYVSPAGTLRTGGHVIDGGYFENYGAETATELLEVLHDRLARLDGHPARPFVLVQISNDTTLADCLTENRPAGLDAGTTVLPPFVEPGSDEAERFVRTTGVRKGSAAFNEVLAPIAGIAATRTARGVLAAKDFSDRARWLEERGRPAVYLHFRLFPERQDPLALGWLLSENSRLAMRRQLRQGRNREALARLLVEIGADPEIVATRLGPVPAGPAVTYCTGRPR